MEVEIRVRATNVGELSLVQQLIAALSMGGPPSAITPKQLPKEEVEAISTMPAQVQSTSVVALAPVPQPAVQIAPAADPVGLPTPGGVGILKKKEIKEIIDAHKLPINPDQRVEDLRRSLAEYVAQQGGVLTAAPSATPATAPVAPSPAPAVLMVPRLSSEELASRVTNLRAWVAKEAGPSGPQNCWVPAQVTWARNLEEFLTAQFAKEEPDVVPMRAFVAFMGCNGKCSTGCPFGPGQVLFCAAHFDDVEPMKLTYQNAVDYKISFKTRPVPKEVHMRLDAGTTELVEQPSV